MISIKDVFLFLIGAFFSYFPTLVFLGLKWGIITRDGFPYNFETDAPHTLIFIDIFSSNSIAFLIFLLTFIFCGHWKYRWWV